MIRSTRSSREPDSPQSKAAGHDGRQFRPSPIPSSTSRWTFRRRRSSFATGRRRSLRVDLKSATRCFFQRRASRAIFPRATPSPTLITITRSFPTTVRRGISPRRFTLFDPMTVISRYPNPARLVWIKPVSRRSSRMPSGKHRYLVMNDVQRARTLEAMILLSSERK